ncbi:MAG: hypothetical protein IJD35_07915 [Clostridia bacterium]|nr:hypothetical protein [Clostridia bacterium]
MMLLTEMQGAQRLFQILVAKSFGKSRGNTFDGEVCFFGCFVDLFGVVIKGFDQPTNALLPGTVSKESHTLYLTSDILNILSFGLGEISFRF